MTFSPYVNTIKSQMEHFRELLVKSQKPPFPQIQQHLLRIIWFSMVTHIFDCLIEGYATEKCSNEGRAIMGIDFQNTQQILEKISEMKPCPNSELVDSYVKAFYRNDKEIDKWLQENHNYYTIKQLEALVKSGSWSNDVKKVCLRYLSNLLRNN